MTDQRQADPTEAEARAQRFAALAAQAGATQGVCSALTEAVIDLHRLTTDRKNWQQVDEIDEKLSRLCAQVSGPAANLIADLRAFTIDKSWRFLFSYAILLLLLTPVASYLLALFLRIGALAKPSLFELEEFEDLVVGVVSAALYLPLFLANKLNMTRRYPLVSPGFLPILLILALVVTLEYLCALFFFLSTSDFSISAFWEHVRLSARTQWLYPLPFVVISINLLTAARFIRFSKETTEFLDNELGEYLRFVATAIIAIAISATIRVGLALIDVGVKPSEEKSLKKALIPSSGGGQVDIFENAYVNTKRLNLRSGPGTEYSVTKQLGQNDPVILLKRTQSSDGGTWVRVRAGSYEGWVAEKLLSKNSPVHSRAQQEAKEISPESEVCTISANTKDGITHGTVYFAGGGDKNGDKIRVDRETSFNNIKKPDHILIDSKMAYFWSKNKGIKFHHKAPPKFFFEVLPGLTRLSPLTKFECQKWTPDNSAFVAPMNIYFLDAEAENNISSYVGNVWGFDVRFVHEFGAGAGEVAWAALGRAREKTVAP